MMEPSTLIRSLDSDDPKIISRAAFDLADSGCIEAIPRLLELLDRNDPATINAIAYALGELKVQGAKPRILECLKAPDFKGSRGSLMYALMCLDCTEDYDDMIELARDASESWEVRHKAVMILDEILPSQREADLISGRARLLERLEEAPAGSDFGSQIEDAIEAIECELFERDGRTTLETP